MKVKVLLARHSFFVILQFNHYFDFFFIINMPPQEEQSAFEGKGKTNDQKKA